MVNTVICFISFASANKFIEKSRHKLSHRRVCQFCLRALQQLSTDVAASHSSITHWHPAHTFLLLPGIRPVTPVRISRHNTRSSGEAKWWTVAVSHCLCAWQCFSQPPLCSHQEMSFSNSFSNALNSSLFSSDKAKSQKQKEIHRWQSLGLLKRSMSSSFYTLFFLQQKLRQRRQD